MKVPTSPIAVLSTAMLFVNVAFAQDNVDVQQCALDCIANVNGTQCSRSEWSCLCQNQMYIEQMNECTYKACNETQEDATFSAVAQLCAIVGFPLTIGPEATASTATGDQIFSTVGIPSQSSMPPVVSSSATSTSAGAASSTTQSNSAALATATSNSAVTGAVNLTQPSLLLLFTTYVGWLTDAW